MLPLLVFFMNQPPEEGRFEFFKNSRRYSQLNVAIDTGGKFAAGVVDTGVKLPLVSTTPSTNLPPLSLTLVANLPPVSTTLAKLVAKFAAGVLIKVANLPSV
jgi:hypothetical protein